MGDDLDPTDDLDEDGDGEDGKKKKKKMSKGKLIGMVAGGLVGLMVIGGSVAYFTGLLDDMLGIEREQKQATLSLGEAALYELPQIKADLKTGLCRSPFLRATLVVQLDESDVEKIEDSLLKVIDAITAHLREQERQDVVGKKGTEKLRFELVNVISAQIAPARVQAILFKEFVLQ